MQTVQAGNERGISAAMKMPDERLKELLALSGDVWALWRAVEPEEIVALVCELQERRATERANRLLSRRAAERANYLLDHMAAGRVTRLLDRWESDDTGYDERAQAALDAASDDALRIVDDAVESDATGGDTWEPTQGDIGGTTCAPETTWGWEEIMRKRADTWKKLAAIDAGELPMPEDGAVDGEAELDAVVVEHEDALLGQTALDAASDEALRTVDDAVESDATASATWQARPVHLRKRPRWLRELLAQWECEAVRLAEEDDWIASTALKERAEQLRLAHNGRKRKPPKLARRVKRLRDEVRTLFGAVGDLTTSKYELGDDLIVLDGQVEALSQRVAALEQWRGSLADEQNDECAEEEWSRQMDEMRAVLRPPRRDCFAICSQLWECDVVVGGVWRTFYGAVPQAAVAAAWKVWKEARDA